MFINNKLFGYLGLSLAIHLAVFSIFTQHAIRTIKPVLSKKSLEVYYERDISQKTKLSSAAFLSQERAKAKLPKIEGVKDEKQPWINNKAVTDFLKKDIFNEEKSSLTAQRPFTEKEGILSNKAISLPPVPGETQKSPEYKSYYQIIREKIKKIAYYNYAKFQEGEIFLTFSLTSKGELIDAGINDKKSSNNEYLRNIALKSIKDASPYPEFPEKLKNNDKLSFNVIISFELK